VDRPRRKNSRRHLAAVTAIAAAVFFLDATKKYGRIITSFAVVPFALARVARVVKSADVNSPRCSSARPFFFHGDVDDRVKFLLHQRACLVARGLAIASPYTALERREKRKTDFTSGSTQYPSAGHRQIAKDNDEDCINVIISSIKYSGASIGGEADRQVN